MSFQWINYMNLKFFNKIGFYCNDLNVESYDMACFIFLSRYFSMNINENTQDPQIEKNLDDRLIYLSEKFNMTIRKINKESIDERIKTPLLTRLSDGKIIIILKIKSNNCVMYDKNKGVIQGNIPSNITDLYEIYKGTYFKYNKSKLNIWSLFFNIENINSFIAKLVILSILIELINILLPIGTQLIMDNVVVSKDIDLLTIICLGLTIFIIFKTISSLIRSWISIVMTSLLDVQWKSSFFWHLINLPLSFFNDKKLGDIKDRFDSLNFIKETYTEVFIRGVIDFIMVLSLITMMFIYGKWLVFVVLGFSLLYALLRFLTYSYYKSLESKKIITTALNNSHVMETLYSLLTIKSLGMETIRKERWMNILIKNNNANINVDKFNMLFLEVNSLMVSIEQIIILYLSATMVIQHEMTVGMFIAFNSYRGVFADRFSNLINILLQFKILDLHGDRVGEVALRDKDGSSMNSDCSLKKINHESIELKNISFSYDDGTNILTDISLKVNKGEHVVITGGSGAGKSTLIKIIAGLIHPSKGEILVNGKSIDHLGVKNYRGIVSCVLQEDKLLSGTIIENITCFSDVIDMAFIIECAKKCNIHNYIMSLPKEYFTEISELGNSLSGGQKQRLMIARALYKKPQILFLDEATSHLDDENEKIINTSISNLNITRIIVAHRQSTIRYADRIFNI
ncbi:peptidase domain-containing ABC transporter [Salmonella enterica subsp. enterica serovar Muenchen]|nr:peptidase domain-containing ABC transporter [Salmonella enterica]EIP1620970.1 peptidase domain-containing ABC transporter [Salmonella enterica]ELE3266951.1 peptidase domain-containing ABC transporter [Salmonella enterica subsp. enterica serovar Muenchen]